MHITLNKNTIVGDTSAMNPSGVRIGTPAITSRGYLEQDSREVGRLLDDAIKIGLDLQKRANSKKLVDFKKELGKSEEISQLADEVQKFAVQFPIPGFDVETLK